MASSMGPGSLVIGSDTTQFDSGLKSAEEAFSRFAKTISRLIDELNGKQLKVPKLQTPTVPPIPLMKMDVPLVAMKSPLTEYEKLQERLAADKRPRTLRRLDEPTRDALQKDLGKGGESAEKARRELDRIGAGYDALDKKGTSLWSGFGKKALIAFGIVAAGVYGVVRFIESTVEKAQQRITAARGLGISPQAYAGLNFAGRIVGLEEGAVGEGMGHFQRTLSHALIGNQEAIHSFRYLGITMQQLRSMTPEQAFQRFFTSLQRFPAGAERTAAASRILERGAVRLAPLYNMSADALQRLMDQQRGMSAGINTQDIERMHQAIVRVNEQFQLFSERLVATHADGIVTGFTVVGDQLQRNNSWVNTLLDMLGAIGKVLLYIGGLFGDYYIGIAGLGIKFAQGMATGLAFVADKLKALLETMKNIPGIGDWVQTAISGIDSFKTTLDKAAADLKSTGDEVLRGWSFGATFNEWMKYWSDMKSTAESGFISLEEYNAAVAVGDAVSTLVGNVEEQRRALEAQVATWGMDERAIAIWRLQQQGATQDMIASLDPMLKQLGILEHQKRIIDNAKRFDQEFESPLDKFDKAIHDLDEAFENNFITWDTYSRGIAETYHRLAQTLGEQKLPERMEFGSRQAVETIQRYQSQDRHESPQEAMKRILDQALREHKEQTRIQTQMAQSLQEQARGIAQQLNQQIEIDGIIPFGGGF